MTRSTNRKVHNNKSGTRASLFALVAAAGSIFLGCGSETPASTPSLKDDAPPVLEAYATLVHASYTDSLTGGQALDASLEAFVTQPSQASLDAAKKAWLDARVPYLQTEAFRFYGGPIDDADGPEERLNAWPMDEAYIDYVEGDPMAGIINDPTNYPKLDEDAIAALNLQGGEKNVASGYHAIEFLLWGQDMNDAGPGNRPFTDYAVDGQGTAKNQDRRGAYLKATSKLMVRDLAPLVDAWAPEGSNYRSSFVASAPEDALRLILLGMGSLSGAELAGERMQVAYDTKEQEDEHSCFSDNTLNDLLNDAISIQNVYLGKYGKLDLPGVDELVRARDPELDARLQTQLAASVAAIQAIPAPFDQAIKGDDSAEGRKRIKAAIDALRTQTTTIVEVATLLGIQLNLEE